MFYEQTQICRRIKLLFLSSFLICWFIVCMYVCNSVLYQDQTTQNHPGRCRLSSGFVNGKWASGVTIDCLMPCGVSYLTKTSCLWQVIKSQEKDEHVWFISLPPIKGCITCVELQSAALPGDIRHERLQTMIGCGAPCCLSGLPAMARIYDSKTALMWHGDLVKDKNIM